ncbi:MAG: zinc-ribbon domain containing protein [Desulfobacterales bacterium]|jgi:hypothetical protein
MVLDCMQCGKSFVFSVAEQARCEAKGFDTPRRCPDCRRKKEKTENGGAAWKDKGRKRHSRRRNNESVDMGS